MSHRLYDDHHILFTLYQGKEATEQYYPKRLNTNIAVLDQIWVTRMGSNVSLTKVILKERD